MYYEPQPKRRRNGKITMARPARANHWKTTNMSDNYNYMPKYRVDNMNPVTEGRNGVNYTLANYAIRVPSKKHKNRYKNFLKLFPWYKPK